jgi:hypothetical protein
MAFTFVSDGYNGGTRDNTGQPAQAADVRVAVTGGRKRTPATGLTWGHPLDLQAIEGVTQAQRVPDYVFDHAFTPLKK